MTLLRLTLVLAVLSVTPAAAQDVQFQLDQLRAQQEQSRQRDVEQSNRLMSMEAQMRADQALRDVAAQQQRPQAPEPVQRPGDAGPTPVSGGFVSIPDDRLAKSRARVREATSGR